MAFSGVTDGTVRIRPLSESTADVANLARWLSDPRVLEFYEGRDNPHDEAKVREVFYARRPATESACIIEYEERPIGYVQFYPLGPDDTGFLPGAPVYGMDQVIGEPDCWNKGIGSRMIRLVTAYLFEQAGAQAVVMDPLVTNTRAIRAYEKCGFAKVALLPGHERKEGVWTDAWLMRVTAVAYL